MARQHRQFPQGKYILRSQNKSQNYAVYLYYYWKGKQVRHSVDLYVSPSDWNQEANGGVGEFRFSYGPNYKERNAYLRELMHDIDSKIMDYIKQHGEIDGDTIEAFVSGDDKVLRSDNGIDFIEFAKQRFIDRYKSGKIGVSSRENGISYINQFGKFLKQEHRGSHGEHSELLFLGEITEQLVLDFRNWQLGNDRKVDTVNKVVQAIGGVCQYASQMRFVPIEVTLAIKDLHLSDKSLDADDVRVKYLTEEQLKEFAGIRDTLPHIRMKEFHDMFMFSFYACGLRLIDMMTLRWVDIDLKKQVIRKIQVKMAFRKTDERSYEIDYDLDSTDKFYEVLSSLILLDNYLGGEHFVFNHFLVATDNGKDKFAAMVRNTMAPDSTLSLTDLLDYLMLDVQTTLIRVYTDEVMQNTPEFKKYRPIRWLGMGNTIAQSYGYIKKLERIHAPRLVIYVHKVLMYLKSVQLYEYFKACDKRIDFQSGFNEHKMGCAIYNAHVNMKDSAKRRDWSAFYRSFVNQICPPLRYYVKLEEI